MSRVKGLHLAGGVFRKNYIKLYKYKITATKSVPIHLFCVCFLLGRVRVCGCVCLPARAHMCQHGSFCVKEIQRRSRRLSDVNLQCLGCTGCRSAEKARRFESVTSTCNPHATRMPTFNINFISFFSNKPRINVQELTFVAPTPSPPPPGSEMSRESAGADARVRGWLWHASRLVAARDRSGKMRQGYSELCMSLLARTFPAIAVAFGVRTLVVMNPSVSRAEIEIREAKQACILHMCCICVACVLRWQLRA